MALKRYSISLFSNMFTVRKVGSRDFSPVGRDVDLGNLEVEVGHSSDRDAVASRGEVEQPLL